VPVVLVWGSRGELGIGQRPVEQLAGRVDLLCEPSPKRAQVVDLALGRAAHLTELSLDQSQHHLQPLAHASHAVRRAGQHSEFAAQPLYLSMRRVKLFAEPSGLLHRGISGTGENLDFGVKLIHALGDLIWVKASAD
jgi:hypothetical protein